MGSGARDRLARGATRWEALVRHDRSTDVSVVTSAGLSHSEDIALRQRRYILTQSVRIVCVILATALPVPVPYKAALLFGAIALPWFGVVMANAGPTVRRKDKTALRGAEPPLHRQIEPGRVIDAER
jgi:hypothetical protein